MENIFCATYPFFESFKVWYPNIKIITGLDDIKKANMIIFTGGEDINPEIYGQKPTHSYFNIRRDAVEITIYKKAIEYNVPKIVGVCRGHQLICALSGGILFQDIKIETGENHEERHRLNFLNGGGIVKDCFNCVNSLHHQGVFKVDKLTPTSIYKDVIESCEGEVNKTKIVTVQFHPEWLDYSKKFFDVISEEN